MPNKNISDVFFDLDHTLWDFDRNSALAFERVFKQHKIELELSHFIREYEPINLHYWKLFGEDRITKQELRRMRLIDTFGILKLELPLPHIDLLGNSYIEELALDNHLFSDAVEILDYLFAKYRLHIITNGFEDAQHLKLENSGIREYFTTITTSDEAGVKKPHQDIFKLAMAKAAISPERSVMIGDSLEADILGANKFGMNSIFFNYRNEKIDSTQLAIYTLSEIKVHL